MPPPRPHLATRTAGRRRGASTLLTTLAALVVLLAGSLSASGPAARAGSAPGTGSAAARAAQVDAGTMTVTSSLTALGGLINLTPLASTVTSALVNPLLQLPGRLTTALADGLTGAGLSATNGTTQQPRPTSGYPTCGQRGWTSTNCYGPVVPGVSVPSLVTLGTGAVQGYATGDKSGWAAASRTANLQLALLGTALGDLGVTDAGATCTTTTCAATQALTGGSLFGGALSVGIANGTTLAKIGATTVGAVPVNVVPGVTASLNQNLLTLTIDLTLTQLLSAIGTTLSALGTLLGGTVSDNGTTASLVVTLGPGTKVSDGGGMSSAWGLNVGIGLVAAIKLRIPLVVSIGVTVGGTQPSLAALKLAYATTSAGATLPGFVPVTVI